MPRVLSIQSEVVYGHVGNTAARFVLQRLGVEVMAVPTVLLAHHPGHGPPAGRIFPADELRALIAGLDGHGMLRGCDAVLSGYLGAPDHAAVVAEAVARVQALNPDMRYCLDPVFGDEEGAYAKPGVAEAMARTLLPLADIVTPNRFELQSLSGRAVTDVESALAAARSLGRPLVVATSIPAGPEHLATLAVAGDHVSQMSVARVADPPKGTGDVLTAAFLAHRLNAAPLDVALLRAALAVDYLLHVAVSERRDHLPLVSEQDELGGPIMGPAPHPPGHW